MQSRIHRLFRKGQKMRVAGLEGQKKAKPSKIRRKGAPTFYPCPGST